MAVTYQLTCIDTYLQNVEEIHTIINIVKKYYNNKKYCVITPYDPQRGAITDALAADVDGWEEVYNVDSFQGTWSMEIIFASSTSSAQCRHGWVQATKHHTSSSLSYERTARAFSIPSTD